MLILLEGMDKTGKSTIAEILRTKFKCAYVHMSTPYKYHTRETYFAEMLHTIALTAGRNVVIDRTWYGELVWPHIYDRVPLLDGGDVETLNDVAATLHKHDYQKIYMHDPDKEAHQERLSKYKEPSYDYDLTRKHYENIANLYSFSYLTFQEAVKLWT